MNDWEKEFNGLHCDKCRADQEHPNEECGVENQGGLYVTKRFIQRHLREAHQQGLKRALEIVESIKPGVPYSMAGENAALEDGIKYGGYKALEEAAEEIQKELTQ